MKVSLTSRKTVSALLAAAVALGLAGVAAVSVASPAAAAPAACTASDNTIYTAPPAASIGAPGTLISCSPTKVTVAGNVAMKAWKVQYASTDVHGTPVAVSGTIAVPTATWKGTGTRPVIAFNPGTLGIGGQCAFSKQLTGQYQDMYEQYNVQAALQAGYAFAATDGIGYLNGQSHPYVIGESAGHAVLDIARTAAQVPGGGLSAGTEVGIWGYSEGGQASLWAAQLAASYAPELNVAGAAAGGVPGDLKLVASQLNGGPFAGFLADAVIGLSSTYPALPFATLLNDGGRAAIADAKKLCLLGTLARFLGAKVEDFTTQKLSLDAIYQLAGPDGTTWGQVLDAQKLGVDIGRAGSGKTYEIGFPTFQYRGAAEEVINTKATDNTRSAYCRAGIPTQWNSAYPGEHLTVDTEAVNDVVTWFGDRFAGKATRGNC